jgi:hypothetical protein
MTAKIRRENQSISKYRRNIGENNESEEAKKSMKKAENAMSACEEMA